MKIKLLKKARRKIKFFERNGRYYVDTGNYIDVQAKNKDDALSYYRFWVLETARTIFGFKPKARFFKY